MIRIFLAVVGILFAGVACDPNDSDSEPIDTSFEVVINNNTQHDMIYKRGTEAIMPHIKLMERDPESSASIKQEVTNGIADLNAVTKYRPENWAAFWVKGKAYQVLEDHQSAYSEFKASFQIQKENPDVARELAAACLALGRADEAIIVTQHAIDLTPGDAGLYANLALAYLVADKNADAKKAIDQSLQMAPDDEISQAVKTTVDEVISGKRPQPKTMADLK